MNSDGEIDQLKALRLKMKSAKFNLPSSESEESEENETPGMRKKFRTKKRSSNMGAQLGKLKSKRSGNM